MNTFAACSLLSSGLRWLISTKLCPFAQTAFCSPTWGRKPIPHCSFGAVVLRSLICQMPSQVTAFLPILNALYWVSRATFRGLKPFLIWSTIQLSAATPASELKVALAPSSVYGAPPFCHSRDRNIRCAGHWEGIQNGVVTPAVTSLDSPCS